MHYIERAQTIEATDSQLTGRYGQRCSMERTYKSGQTHTQYPENERCAPLYLLLFKGA